ncbi:MAG: thermosome subunit beta [Halobacteriota archaeon]|nr:thermosome subunit beta [Halobacteriota archaeon]
MGGQLGGQPIIILREGSERTRGSEAQNNNIMAVKTVASAVRTTLGPKGMDKMLVDSLGDVVITNDGVTILKEMDIDHPAAKMVVEVAKTQDNEAGDGTTTAVVIAGELLKKAEDLLDQDVHPTIVASGYRMAAEKAKEILSSIAAEASIDSNDLLESAAVTSMTGKGAGASKEKLSKLVVKAVRAIVDKTGEKYTADTDNISIEKKVGGSIDDTELISGIVIDKERVHSGMPKKIEGAKIALVNTAIEIEKTEFDAEISIGSPDQLQAFLSEEESMLKRMVDKVTGSGANVLLCQKGIDDLVQHYLAKAGILAVRRVKEADMKKMARASGGKILTNLEEISADDLGTAGVVEEKKIGGDQMIFVTECDNPKSVSILVRGGTEHVVDEIERSLHDALRVVGSVIEDGKFVAGGGSPEVELALRLKEYGASLKGREQLAVQKFADALEIVPRTLAENAGLDPIDKIVELRSKHEQGDKNAGLNVYSGKVVDMLDSGVVEPLRVKVQAVSSASSAAIMILRIDDVIASSKMGGMPGGMPPGGMGGMPPGMM